MMAIPPLPRLVLLSSLLLWGGLGCQEPRCEPICHQLTSTVEEGGCGYTTWGTVQKCQEGCSTEVLRRPDADAILTCFENAAGACNSFEVIRCRLQEGPDPGW